MRRKAMEVKEAIDFCEQIKYSNVYITKEYQRKIGQVQVLLKQGEALKAENVELKAYKQIVEELKGKRIREIETNPIDTVAISAITEMEIIEQKYLKEERK